MPSIKISKMQKRKLDLISFHNNCTIGELMQGFIDYEYKMMLDENDGVEPDIINVNSVLKPYLKD